MDTVQALRGDPDSSEAEHARIMLVQTEVERVKFVVRSYIRTRLYKVRTRVAPSEANTHTSHHARLKNSRDISQLRPRYKNGCPRQSWIMLDGALSPRSYRVWINLNVLMIGSHS